MRKRYLLPLLIVLSVVSVFIGVEEIKPGDIFHLTREQVEILLISRLPRLISIITAGIGMSICGLIMQQLTRNKFVSPTTAGTMDCARLGILVSIIVFSSASMIVKMGVAFCFALAGTLVFMKILSRIKWNDTIFIPLVGIMFGNIIGSVSTFFAYKYDLIQSLSSWLQGDFSGILKGRYEMMYMTVPAVLIAYLFANQFTVAGMGEDFAKNLGLKYKQAVNIGLILVALITSAVVLTIGSIPFLGLIIPNIVSIYRGDHIKKSITVTALLGADFLLFCDILGRVVIYPYEVPISLTVGIIGSAIFVYLLLRGRSYA
ncbi:ABC transporter permease [Heyndrickxia acidiproducens]|uniref:ABC transporter permease n=1 Tax=Heyndrickxia acidiproducens TaxID=1121084 RepID=UPI000370E24A|nr:ABC transporter permease [Heyndrickxia acidiproducens]